MKARRKLPGKRKRGCAKAFQLDPADNGRHLGSFFSPNGLVAYVTPGPFHGRTCSVLRRLPLRCDVYRPRRGVRERVGGRGDEGSSEYKSVAA